nr:interleukin-11 receptor subunit alpha isoform X1 [Misgurnus anguillicaudatus]
MPGLLSCPGGLIVIGITALFSVHIKSEIWTNEVSDVQFGRLGSRVTLRCEGYHGRSPVEWRLNGSSVQISEGSLTLLNARQSMEGNYSCHDGSGTLLQTIKLRLGYQPHFLQISCHVPNHEKIYCSWNQTKKTHLPTSYISSYSTKAEGVKACEQEYIGENKCTITNHSFWSSRVYINITEINPLGSNSTILKLDLLELLKPGPPEAVEVLQVEGQPTQLLVHWKYPASWTDDNPSAFPLTFLLRYRPAGSNYWSKVETEDTSLRIMDVLEGHLHQIQVRAQDALINHSQWSEWSHVAEARPWTEPREELTEDSLNIPFINSFPVRTTDKSPEFTEELTEDPLNNPFINSFPVRTTDKSPDSSIDQNEGFGLLVMLCLFAAFMVAVLLTIIALLWVRHRKRDNVKNQELTSMVKMKSIPI